MRIREVWISRRAFDATWHVHIMIRADDNVTHINLDGFESFAGAWEQAQITLSAIDRAERATPNSNQNKTPTIRSQP